MKWNFGNSVVTLFSASLLCISNHGLASASSPEMVSISQTFREPKNIALAGGIGGTSHFAWVLSIMDELANRGHNMTFFAKDEFIHLADPYPQIPAVCIGPQYEINRTEMIGDPEIRKDMTKMFPFMLKIITSHLEKDYKTMIDMIKLHKIDVLICDHWFDPCMYAANAAKIPFIVTSSHDITKDSAAPYINNDLLSMVHPTTDTQTFFDRIDKRFIAQFRLLRRIWPQVLAINKRKKELGITDSSDPTTAWKDSVKLINNIFGLMAARPIGPLVQAVGPIIPSKYEAPSGDLKYFLEGHKRLAYIAFGQNATPSDDDIRLILAALMETIESGELDGFIWATVITGRGLFPEYVTTSSNKKYSVSDMFNDKNPDIRFVQWAPQAAILFHPSTTLFISHGGLNSWSESLYAGVPIVMYPFFGDQPANSKLNEQANLGATLNPYKTVKETADLLKKVIKDEDGEIGKALKRYQALIQIHSSHGIINGANIIEEVAFVNVDGKLPHRYPASRKMNYFKARDLDINTFMISIILGFLVTLFYTTKHIFNVIVSKTSVNEKPKSQ